MSFLPLNSAHSPAPAIGYLTLIKTSIVADVQNKLAVRGVQSRSSSDDDIFINFNVSLAMGAIKGLQHAYIDIFHEIEHTTLQFEKRCGTEIHKGSIYFNVALLYLWSGDFDHAMYYWSQAESEDKATTGSSTQNIYASGLFQANFLDMLQQWLEPELLLESSVASKLIGTHFSYSDFNTHLRSVDNHHLINLIINLYKYSRYNLDNFAVNPATSILFYRLVADSCLMFETLLKAYLISQGQSPGKTIGAILNNDLRTTAIGDISNEWGALSRTGAPYKCRSISDYNTLLRPLLIDIRNETSRLKLSAKLLHLAYMTRNQVNHQIDDSLVLYGDYPLCNEVLRMILLTELFDNYI